HTVAPKTYATYKSKLALITTITPQGVEFHHAMINAAKHANLPHPPTPSLHILGDNIKLNRI
ncbi:MAG: hypothetical protein MJA29_09295, partial [Candidatus Omnitrophica bacterium]|nr:hypothetical protein [Candidatus Omnitrophota bacterium]